MTRAKMLIALDYIDILEVMLSDNEIKQVENHVKIFYSYRHIVRKEVLNAILIYALMHAKHFNNFIAYLRKTAETFERERICTASNALEFIKRMRDNTNTRKRNTNNEPEWLDRYLKEIEQMG